MGTNYYLDHPQFDELLHIGKSSAGWRFTFHEIKGVAESEADWRKITAQGDITDEYDRNISNDGFWKLVEAKKHQEHQLGLRPDDNGDFLAEDFS